MIQVELDTSWPPVRASCVEIDTSMIQVELDTSWPQIGASRLELDIGMKQIQPDTGQWTHSGHKYVHYGHK
jgi:hypothetical protein